jgi:hypothetical protein
VALASSFELLMTLTRTESPASATPAPPWDVGQHLPIADHDVLPALTAAPTLELTVRPGMTQATARRRRPASQAT